MAPKISIIGGGNVGANTAFFLAEQSVADVYMYDIQDTMPHGKALDLMETAPIRGYQRYLGGIKTLQEAMNSDVIILCAGTTGTPGMSRAALLNENRGIIGNLSDELKGFKGTVVVVSEPVDELTQELIEKSGLPSTRVIGLSGHLNTLRLRSLVSRELNITAENISAMVVGSHGKNQIPLENYTRISGIPVNELLDKKTIEKIFNETCEAGEKILKLAERTGAYYAPAAAAADLSRAIIMDTGAILSVSVLLNGEYGLSGICRSLPCIIGKEGVRRVLAPKLTAQQLEQFKTGSIA